ncbi:MAG: DUF4177 domain-containing protein [Oscillospiraceae bacterium]|nr:DUF4177 domain-containing protein [Oscillospiraceae bacterium]
MFEYKSVALSIHKEMKGLKLVKTIVDHVDTAKLDELINKQATEGWELVAHSSVVDTVIGRVNAIVTFRRPK